MFVNTLVIPFCGCRGPWFLFPSASVAFDQPRTSIHFSCNIFCSAPHFDQNVDDILDPHRTSLSFTQDYLLPLALVSKAGAPQRAFPTFIFLQSFAFRDWGPSMVWDNHTKIYTEPLADKREHAMGFRTGTTLAHGLSKD